VTDGEGRIWRYGYDQLNRKILETDPLGYEVSYRYTPDDLLESVTNKRGKSTRFTYDAMGRISKISYEYDCRNRLIRKVDPLGGVTEFEYDAAGNLLKRIDPNGNVFLYEYDLLGRVTKSVDPMKKESSPSLNTTP